MSSTKFITPEAFLSTISATTRADRKLATSADKPNRIATVDPGYTSGNARVTFDGETLLSVKAYPYVGPYVPSAGDRVVLAPVGTSYVILGGLGAVASSIIPRAQWDLKLEQLFRGLTDTNFAAVFAAIFADPSWQDGDIIYARPGTYPLTAAAVISKPCTIIGRDAKFTATTNFRMFNVTASNVELYDLEFVGPGSTTYSSSQFCVYIGGATWAAATSNIIMERCKFSAIAGNAIQAEFAKNVRITGCQIRNYVRSGVMILSCDNVLVNWCYIDTATNGTGNPSSNCYPIAFSRNTNAGITLQPRSSNCTADNNYIINNPFWEGIDTHGGINILVINNTILSVDQPIAIVGSADTGGASTFAPHHCTVRDNYIDSQVTNGTRDIGIIVQGCGTVLGSPVETAEGNKVLGNTVIGHGHENTSSSGGMFFAETRDLMCADNNIKECSSNGIAVAGDNYNAQFRDNNFVDNWSSNTGFVVACFAFYVAYGDALVDGNTMRRGSKSAARVNYTGIRIGNTTPNPTIVIPPTNKLDPAANLELWDLGTVKARKQIYSAELVASGNLVDPTLTTTFADIPGATLTFTTYNHNVIVEVVAIFDMAISSTAAAGFNLFGTINVDGTDQTKNAALSASIANNRATVSMTYRVTLATPGSHTIKMRGRKNGGASTTHSFQSAGTQALLTIRDVV